MKKQAKKSGKAESSVFTVLSPEAVALTEVKEVSQRSFAQCVRALMQNWRQGTVACKGRSDVAYADRKPWKQKGTGRARAGSARSPLWRGGGITFGPQPRTRVLSVPKTLKRNVLAHLAHQFLSGEKVVSLNWDLKDARPKTAQAFEVLKDAGLHNERLVVFIPAHDALTAASFANLPKVRVLYFDQPNVVDLSHADRWVVLNKDVEQFKTMVSQWI